MPECLDAMMGVDIKYMKTDFVLTTDAGGRQCKVPQRTNDKIGISRTTFYIWAFLFVIPDMGWDELLQRVSAVIHYENQERAVKNIDSSLGQLLQLEMITPAQVIANNLVEGPAVKRYIEDMHARMENAKKLQKQYDEEIAELQARKNALAISAEDAGPGKEKARKKPGKE